MPEGKVFLTGNTVIDALMLGLEMVRPAPPIIKGLPADLTYPARLAPLVLITGHRRENFGPRLEAICGAILSLATEFPGTAFVYPVHLNPSVREPVHRLIDGQGLANIHLVEPLSYLEFVALMNRSTLILTDSGGIQEEAPSLGKPVLVMRDTTERPEAVDAGTVRLVGTDERAIVDGVSHLLTDRASYDAMSRGAQPLWRRPRLRTDCRRVPEVL